MAYYAVLSGEDDYVSTAVVLSFESMRARAAFQARCGRGVEIITPKKKDVLVRVARHPLHEVVWDGATGFRAKVALVPPRGGEARAILNPAEGASLD